MTTEPLHPTIRGQLFRACDLMRELLEEHSGDSAEGGAICLDCGSYAVALIAIEHGAYCEMGPIAAFLREVQA